MKGTGGGEMRGVQLDGHRVRETHADVYIVDELIPRH